MPLDSPLLWSPSDRKTSDGRDREINECDNETETDTDTETDGRTARKRRTNTEMQGTREHGNGKSLFRHKNTLHQMVKQTISKDWNSKKSSFFSPQNFNLGLESESTNPHWMAFKVFLMLTHLHVCLFVRFHSVPHSSKCLCHSVCYSTFPALKMQRRRTVCSP